LPVVRSFNSVAASCEIGTERSEVLFFNRRHGVGVICRTPCSMMLSLSTSFSDTPLMLSP
jgi:hypothetical protein